MMICFGYYPFMVRHVIPDLFLFSLFSSFQQLKIKQHVWYHKISAMVGFE